MSYTFVLEEIELPDFGQCEELIEIPATEFERRMQATLERMKQKNLDFLLVFADREHTANLAYLTRLDPRFEEALLLLHKSGTRKMLLGNECMGYRGICPIPMEFELYQEFSLAGQDRSKSRSLQEIFQSFGIGRGSIVGCSYYKYFSDELLLDIPSYLANTLINIVGAEGKVMNASAIFMDAETGLRQINRIEELVRFEWASTRTSESIKNLVKEIKPGIREYELARNYISDGLPYSCHPMVSTGKKAALGLSSPSGNKVTLKDPFTSAFGIWGALTCRAGMVAAYAEQLDKEVADFFEKYWRSYFNTVVTWYENIGIGISAGEITEKVGKAMDEKLFDFAVNTGHTLHIDEWVNSPFFKGSTIKLYSGMALQMDIIPVSKGAFVCANMEDGIVLADEQLQSEWASRFPASWKRIRQRRDFMINKIGISIKPEVLPLSNIPAYYSPYLLNPKQVGVNKRKN
jgi:Xaa-Pro aminopeptidase